jgi:hypothetical protein
MNLNQGFIEKIAKKEKIFQKAKAHKCIFLYLWFQASNRNYFSKSNPLKQLVFQFQYHLSNLDFVTIKKRHFEIDFILKYDYFINFYLINFSLSF